MLDCVLGSPSFVGRSRREHIPPIHLLEETMERSKWQSIMASGFTAHEFGLGLGLRLTQAIRNDINESQQRYERYVLTGDAELVKGSPIKTEFKDSYDSCLSFFRSGVQHEGYWNSSHTI